MNMIKKLLLSLLVLTSNVLAQVYPAHLVQPTAIFDAQSPATLFTTDTGTTIANYGDAVGRWGEALGKATPATQATAGSRPIRATAPITGVRNLLDRTEEFDDAYWTKSTTTITANATTAPNGTLTADKVTANASAGSKDVRRSLTVPNATVHTYSFYAKAAEYNFISTFVGFSNATLLTTYNLSNCTITATSPNATSFIEDAGNGWCRCSIRVTSNSTSGIIYTYINSDGTSGGTSFTGDGTSGVYVWGAQLEVGSPAPYQRRITQHEVYEAGVPNRDYLWFDGSDDFVAADGLASILTGTNTPHTIIAITRSRDNSALRVPYSVARSSVNTPLDYMYVNTATNRLEQFRRADGGTNVTINYGTPLNTTPNIYSMVYSGTGGSAYKNGALQSSHSTSLGATTFDWFTIGSMRRFGDTSGFWLGDYYALLIFDKALTEQERQAVEGWAGKYYKIGNWDPRVRNWSLPNWGGGDVDAHYRVWQ